MRVLIPGMAGGLARQVALRLYEAGHTVSGIDVRPWVDRPRAIALYRADLRKRSAEEVFRRVRPEVVVHMATVTSLSGSPEERDRVNLGGTQAVFEWCRQYGVGQCVFVGRHTFYGAGPDTALYHREDEPPQQLGAFPELADLVAADLYAATAIWRIPAMTTTVLRVSYTLGPSGHGTLATFLRGRYVPSVLGYDPLYQFLHEDDAVKAITLAIEHRLRGIWNVAGPQPLPLTVLAREAGRTPIPIPEPMLALVLGRAGLPRLPQGALGHLKYPVVVDPSAFQKATGFRHAHDELRTCHEFRQAFPVPGGRR